MGQSAILEISVSEFKAKCLAIFKELEAHQIEKVVVTRRGKAVAELRPPVAEARTPLYGALAGRVHVPPGVDLTAPILEDIPEAELGKCYEE